MPVSAKMKRRRGNHLQPGFLTSTNARRGMKKCDLRQEAWSFQDRVPKLELGYEWNFTTGTNPAWLVRPFPVL
uniref:Uncharacterized protein n=2 Tax=Candidatus Kentrum TaxID=2126330 RepID=A0A450VWJ3_9GAMM|nr:MAG: hypothetical protein BECKLPF1236B_GA0070989_100523 [Candidatus Kentron sp. LPFa]